MNNEDTLKYYKEKINEICVTGQKVSKRGTKNKLKELENNQIKAMK